MASKQAAGYRVPTPASIERVMDDFNKSGASRQEVGAFAYRVLSGVVRTIGKGGSAANRALGGFYTLEAARRVELMQSAGNYAADERKKDPVPRDMYGIINPEGSASSLKANLRQTKETDPEILRLRSLMPPDEVEKGRKLIPKISYEAIRGYVVAARAGVTKPAEVFGGRISKGDIAATIAQAASYVKGARIPDGEGIIKDAAALFKVGKPAVESKS